MHLPKRLSSDSYAEAVGAALRSVAHPKVAVEEMEIASFLTPQLQDQIQNELFFPQSRVGTGKKAAVTELGGFPVPL